MKPDLNNIQLSDLVGQYGSYQLFFTTLLFIRYILLGLMANSGPLLSPDVTFYCALPMEEVLSIMPNITLLNRTQQDEELKEEFKQICQIDLHLYLNGSSAAANKLRQSRYRQCTNFTYELTIDQGHTMTSEFDLVCERDWLRSLFQSILSASIVVAHVFWGTFSDKYGRFRAQKLCLLVSFVAGGLSMLASDFWSFVLMRALCSFGDLGLVVSMTTTLVELVGNKYRGVSVAVVNFGFALGVTVLPYVVAHFENFRHVILFTFCCHIASIPIFLATNESARWLLINMRFEQAKRELRRICNWNRSRLGLCLMRSSVSHESLDLLFDKLVQQIESQNLYDPNEFEKAVELERRLSLTTNTIERARSPSQLATITEQPVSEGLLDDAKPEQRRSFSHDLDRLAANIDRRSQSLDIINRLQLTRRSESCGQLSSHLHDTWQPRENRRDPRYMTLPINRPNDTRSRFADLITDDMMTSLRKPAQQPDCINLVASQLSFMGRVNRLFRDKQLMVAVFTIVYTTFNSELQYTSYIIINLEVGEDVYLNYFLGGCMEALAAVVASLLLSYAPRRTSLITFWLLISFACFGLSLAHIDSHWAVWMLALAKFSQSSLSSIASVAAYESFPTFLRQSGSGLVFTLGMLGSVMAPLIFAEFDDHAGMDRVLMTFSFSSLIAALLIHLYLKETKDQELM